MTAPLVRSEVPATDPRQLHVVIDNPTARNGLTHESAAELARIVERGHLSRAGYNMLELGFMRWQMASDDIDPFEYLYVLERHAVETMVEVWASKAALFPQAHAHTPPAHAKAHAGATYPAQSPGDSQTTVVRHSA